MPKVSSLAPRYSRFGETLRRDIFRSALRESLRGGLQGQHRGIAVHCENVDIRSEDPGQPDVQALLDQSDSYFRALYPAESNHLVSADVLGTHRAVFLAARRDGELLGSIALLVIAPGHAEMKRMFVRADARGIGLGRRLLNAMEEVACHRGITRISLETGIKQPEAIGLYRTSGYQDCPPFGDYKHDALSLFMTKSLPPLAKADSGH